MTRAVSVLRVSTRKQLVEGEGIENQRRGNNAYIARKGYTLHREFVLAESADGERRADFAEVLESIVRHKKEIDVVVFWKMDRISRAGVGAYYALKAYLARHDIRIESATEQIDGSATGELMESILAASARFENRVRVDRTIGVERILTKDGYWCRAAPLGFRNARDAGRKPVLEPDPATWGLLREGLLRQATGAYKSSEVADWLRDRGLRTRTGQRLSRQTWEKVCRNPLYGGYLRGAWTDGEMVRARFDGPLSPEEWLRLQDALDATGGVARRLPRKKHHPDFPLRGFLRCPRCGGRSRGYRAAKHGRAGFRYYDCRRADCRFRVPAERAHALFVDYLASLKPGPETLATIRKLVLAAWAGQARDLGRAARRMQRTVAELTRERDALAGMIQRAAGGGALLGPLAAEYERVGQQLAEATRQRGEAELDGHRAEEVVTACLHFLENAGELWRDSQCEARIRLQAMVLPEGVPFGALEGCQTAKLSEIHEWIGQQGGVENLAAPSCRMANSVPGLLVRWYECLRSLPAAVNAASAAPAAA